MSKTSLRLMFINAENLFSPGNRFYGSELTPNQYSNKVDWIGSMIARCQVHVCAISEIGENPDICLQDIVGNVNTKITSGLPFAHIYQASSGAGSTRIRVAAISRFPIDSANSDSLVDYPPGFRVDLFRAGSDEDDPESWLTVPSERYSRPIGRVRINPPNNAKPFNLFIVHLKSKRPKKAAHDNYNEAIGIARSAIQRNVEAAALRFYLDTFLPNQYQEDAKIASILVGDFNDTPTSVPLENIRGSFDKLPGPSSPWTEPDKKRLLSCARLHLKKSAYEDKLFSYVHNESFALIDQAFVTEHLPGKFKRMEVYNDHVFRHQDIASSTVEEDKQWVSTVSDHGAIVVEFTRMLKP